SRGLRRLAITLAFLCAMLATLWARFGKRLEAPIEVYRQVERSLVWRAATAPLRWFVEVILARRLWPDLVAWSSLCLLVNGLLFVTVHVLDARLVARAEEDDGRTAEEDDGPPVSQRVPWALPLLSRCQGLGPIAWRQSMSAVRRPPQIGYALLM